MVHQRDALLARVGFIVLFYGERNAGTARTVRNIRAVRPLLLERQRNRGTEKRNYTMLDSLTSMSLLAGMEILGPLVLAAGLAYGIWVASRRRRKSREVSDQAARRLFQQRDE
jgi:hypothetical protein